MEKCLDLAFRTGRAAGSVALPQTRSDISFLRVECNGTFFGEDLQNPFFCKAAVPTAFLEFLFISVSKACTSCGCEDLLVAD